MVVDLILYNDMWADCKGRGWFGAYEAPCHATATAYYIGVNANSIKQGYGTP
jgi:hypothetical protein